MTANDPNNYKDSILVQISGKNKYNSKYYRKRPIWTMKQVPYFNMKDRNTKVQNLNKGGSTSFVMNVPSYNRMISGTSSLNETVWQTLIIKLKQPENEEHIESVIESLESAMTNDQLEGITIENYFSDLETNILVTRILDWIFNVIIAITMFLCFFSLCSSMSANLFD